MKTYLILPQKTGITFSRVPSGMTASGAAFIVSAENDADVPASVAAYHAAQAKLAYRVARAKRYDAEAPLTELADAETKLLSTDSAVREAGFEQKATWAAKRLQIKSEIPKPA